MPNSSDSLIRFQKMCVRKFDPCLVPLDLSFSYLHGHEWKKSRRWWRTGKPVVLQSMGSQRVRHDWVTELIDWFRKYHRLVTLSISCLHTSLCLNYPRSKVAMCVYMCSCLSRVWLFLTPWTVAHQAPLSMGFPRQEYWSRLPFPSPGDLLTQGSNLGLLNCRQTL